MNETVKTVSVKNKLGCEFGNRPIEVNTKADEQITSTVTISPMDERMIYPLDQQTPVSLQLDSIDIEVLGQGNEKPIPITIKIEPSDDLYVEVNQIGNVNWTLTFNPTIVSGSPGAKEGDSNVNVTLGEDEPDKRASWGLTGAAAGLIAGPLLYRVSPVLWGGAVLASLAVAVVTWFKSAGRERKKQEGESKEPIKKTME